ncbi:ABC transporter ATP-binding protein [bacterium]|nr:ABC transporter ATP-binding protein [bacterium]
MIRLDQMEIRTPSAGAGGPRTILHPLNLDIERGTVLGVFGPNGSGKSSLLKGLSGILLGLELRGEVYIDSVPLRLIPTVRNRVSRILYLGSDFRAPFDLTVRELFEMGAQATTRQIWPETGHQERERIARVVETLGITGFLSRSYPTLSDGERQLMMFARGLIQAPSILVLDETFSKLDLDRLMMTSRLIRNWASADRMTFLIASHDLNFLSEVSDRMLMLRQGRVLAQGGVDEVLTEANLRELFQRISPHVVASPESGKRKILY